MTRGDELHHVAALWHSLYEEGKAELANGIGLTPDELIYVEYAANEDPSKRDYDQLRKWLGANVAKYEHRCINDKLQQCAAFLKANDAAPQVIYDVGAGHGEWCRLLQGAWPKAEVLAIDRFAIPELGSRSLVQDAPEFLRGFEPEYPTLLFMSEFLHCKQEHVKLLGLPNLDGCSMLVVELDKQEVAIDDRLHVTGGGLLDPVQTLRAHGGYESALLLRHEATFRYWDLCLRPREL